jgi:hypothetical protein
MKKTLLALSLFGALAGVAHAQSPLGVGVDADGNVDETLVLCLVPECTVGDGSNPG